MKGPYQVGAGLGVILSRPRAIAGAQSQRLALSAACCGPHTKQNEAESSRQAVSSFEHEVLLSKAVTEVLAVRHLQGSRMHKEEFGSCHGFCGVTARREQ